MHLFYYRKGVMQQADGAIPGGENDSQGQGPNASYQTQHTTVQTLLNDPEAFAKAQSDELELRSECKALEERLQANPLYSENEALEVQLVQMQDDFLSLQEDFRGLREYFGQRITEMGSALQAQVHAADVAEGRASCLMDLARFHEDRGRLAGQYWKTQAEKKDDSIRFLTLKLKEYTMSSAAYIGPTGQRHIGGGDDNVDGKDPIDSGAVVEDPLEPNIGQAYQSLLDNHLELCHKLQQEQGRGALLSHQLQMAEIEEEALKVQLASVRELEASSRHSGTDEVADESEVQARTALLEEENERLRSEVREFEDLLEERAMEAKDKEQLPAWAHRCIWRDELDVRAGQLERISFQFDATKGSLDKAGDELQRQASAAEEVRRELAEAWRGLREERGRSRGLQCKLKDSERRVEDLLQFCERARALNQGAGHESSGSAVSHGDAGGYPAQSPVSTAAVAAGVFEMPRRPSWRERIAEIREETREIVESIRSGVLNNSTDPSNVQVPNDQGVGSFPEFCSQGTLEETNKVGTTDASAKPRSPTEEEMN